MNNFLPVIEGEHDGYKFNWHISIKPASYPPSKEKMLCPMCKGNSRTKVHFGVDDAEDCYHCNNTQEVDKPVEWHPNHLKN